jgi:hypothetical protein
MNRDEEYFMLAVASEASEMNASARKRILRVAHQHLSGEQPRIWTTMRLLESIYHGDSRAKETVQLGDVLKVKADAKRVNAVIEKIARGLHFLDFGRAMDAATPTERRMNPPVGTGPQALWEASVRTIGPEFRYRVHQDGNVSYWHLEFYERVSGFVRLG